MFVVCYGIFARRSARVVARGVRALRVDSADVRAQLVETEVCSFVESLSVLCEGDAFALVGSDVYWAAVSAYR